ARGVDLAEAPGLVLAGCTVVVGESAVEHRRSGGRDGSGVVALAAVVGLGQDGFAVLGIDVGVGLELLAGRVVGAEAGLVPVLDGRVGPIGRLFPPARHDVQRRGGGLSGVLVVAGVLSM